MPDFVFDDNLLDLVSLRVHVDSNFKVEQPSLVTSSSRTPNFSFDQELVSPFIRQLRKFNSENLFFEGIICVVVYRLEESFDTQELVRVFLLLLQLLPLLPKHPISGSLPELIKQVIIVN
jgi:hypothetical protein